MPNSLVALFVDAKDIVQCLVLDFALHLDLIVHGIEPHDTVQRLQGPVLPRLYIQYDPVGYLAKYGVRDIRCRTFA